MSSEGDAAAGSEGRPQRYRLLDGLRALASLSVVVWHYQHFFYQPESRTVRVDAAEQPFFAVLFPFYGHGALAVDFFFVLSGFIFFALYARKITDGQVGGKEFAILRLSRLYPLHFVTWFGVALLQGLYYLRYGSAFVFQQNTATAWLLGLIFVVGWSPFESAFNAPSWSVSVEILLYVAFFMACRIRAAGSGATFALALASCAAATVFPKLGGGLSSFFIGGCCFHLVAFLEQGTSRRRTTGGLVAAVVLLGATSLLAVWSTSPWQQLLSSGGELVSSLAGRSVTGSNLSNRGLSVLLLRVIFPSLVILGALVERWTARARLPWLQHFGDTTYAVYLIHFPLQVLCVIVLGSTPSSRTIFLSEWFFLSFFATVLFLGWFVFIVFERPAQRVLRSAFLLRPKKSTHSDCMAAKSTD